MSMLKTPRWKPGSLYAVPLTPRKSAVIQLLTSPYAAIFNETINPESPIDAMGGVDLSVYRVLAVSGGVLKAASHLGQRPLAVTALPHFFSRSPDGEYELWTPLQGARSATREECLALEPMAIWDQYNLEVRLRSQFLRGGYTPPEDDQP